MNEIRNELLGLLSYVNSKEEDKKIMLDMVLDRFEYDIKDQLKDIEYKKQELENNLKTLEYVRNELSKEGK